jgi:NAD(P)-dependent dehydrogenase (short-subunit alcohol dehydrogenase family)
MVSPMRISIIGSGALAQQLGDHFNGQGHEVTVSRSASPDHADRPLDLAIIVDAESVEAPGLAAVTRADLAAALQRFTHGPFAAGVALRPRLAAAKGRLVLLTSATARMEHVDSAGAYLERPFRAAAHALWRCLSVEWAGEGIACGLLAIEREPEPTALARAILDLPNDGSLVELRDLDGTRLGW